VVVDIDDDAAAAAEDDVDKEGTFTKPASSLSVSKCSQKLPWPLKAGGRQRLMMMQQQGGGINPVTIPMQIQSFQSG